MAKQYIPGVSGLLTEPNPADSPSNTLSEAENVVVDQSGKVQARHGINVNPNDTTSPYYINDETYYPIWQIRQVNQVLGDNQVTMYGGSFVETFTDNITYSSFYESSDYFFKFFEAKTSNEKVFSGYLVKQSRNQYGPITTTGGIERFVVDKGTSDINFIYYKLNTDTGKIEKAEKINYREITDIFDTRTSMYVQTEDGLAESNIDDMIRPTENRFFTIQWPAYPKLSYRIIKSDLFGNWLSSGSRCGVRFTFYREMGYTDSDTDLEIYESQPSRIYEIINNGTDGVPVIDLDFSAVLGSDDFKRYNLFTKFNNGRKFGIRLYRTTAKPLTDANNEPIALGDEYFQCYDDIPFDSFFTSSFDLTSVLPGEPLYTISDPEYWFRFKNYGNELIYRPNDVTGEYNIGDTISYILNDSDINGNKLYNRYVFSSNQKALTQFTSFQSFTQIDPNDYLPAKLEIADKTLHVNQILVSPNDSPNYRIQSDTTRRTRYDEYLTASASSSYNNYLGYTFKNTEDFDKYTNQAQVYIELYNNVISSLEFTGTVNIPASPDNQLIVVKSGVNYSISLTSGVRTLAQIASEINSNSTFSINGIKAYVRGNYLYISRIGNIDEMWIAQSTFAIKPNAMATLLFGGQKEMSLTYSTTGFEPEHRRIIFPDNSAIKVEIWEYEEKVSGFTESSPYLKLTRRIASGETVFNSASTGTFTPVSFTVYEQQPEQTVFYNAATTSSPNKGFYGLIKVNFDQNFNFESGKSYFCSISTKNFVDNQFSFKINAVDSIDNVESPYNVDVFKWAANETPKYSRTITNTNPLNFVGYNITFTRQISKYAYKLKTIGNIFDSFTNQDFSTGGATVLYAYNQNTGLLNTDKKTLYLSRPTIFTTDPATSTTINVTFDGGTDTFTVNNVRLKNGQYIRFYNIFAGDPPSPFVFNTWYQIQNVVVTETSSTLSTTFKLNQNFTTSGTTTMQILADEALITNRYFIRNFTIPLELNDDGIIDIRSRLYTDKNLDGAVNTNLIAPNCKVIMPYKDFYIYANLKKPLTASFSVTALPKTEQVSCYLVNTLNGTSIGTGFTLSTTNFGISNAYTLNPTTSIQNGPVYVDSALYRKPTYINATPATSILRTVDSMITVNKATTALTSTNFPFNATLFERPYLTLKLTSMNNVIDYVTIQTEALYNRNGYYAQRVNGLDVRSNSYDDRYLQFNKTANEGNSFVPTTTTSVVRNSYAPGMKAGTKDGECETQFSFVAAAATNLGTSAASVYFNATASTLVLTGISQFDIDTFKAPGHILIQGITDGVTTAYNYALFTYQTVVADTTAVNKFTFGGVKDVYASINGEVVSTRDSTTWTAFGYKTIHGWFIQATSDGTIPLYSYYSPYLNTVYVDSQTKVIEYWEQDAPANALTSFEHLAITFKPHRKRSQTPVAIFSSTGNHLYVGSNRTTTEAFWDEYATLIVDRFNAELQYRNIKASLRRGSGIGEVIVSYPDGYSIEILNGKYDVTTNTVTYPGNHRFIPDIGKSQSTTSPVFTKLAVRNNNDLNIKNEAYFSRRRIPEICPAQAFIQIGAPDKEIIGYAENTDDLYVFKEDGVFRVVDVGTQSTNIPSVSVYQFSVNHVCQAAGSIQEINDEIIFLSQYGFTSIAGGGIQNISGSIQNDVLTLMQTSPKYRIKSFVNETKNLYYCTLINEVDETLDVKSGTYIFNTKTRQWSFMTEEIIDGLEDYKHRNLVAYRQKSVLAETALTPYQRYDTYERIGFSSGQTVGINYKIDQFEVGYPIETINKYRNFYYISREHHTNNLYQNAADQYDFISDTCVRDYIIDPGASPNPGYNVFNVNTLTNGFNIRILDIGPRGRGPTANKTLSTLTYFVPRNMTMDLYPISIYGENIIIDSFLQFFADRNVRAKMVTEYNSVETQEMHEIKITKIEYADVPIPDSFNLRPVITYTFEFLNGLSENWSNKTLKQVQILCGVPVKITFNPESGAQPDSNKLFQEFMVHTETFNKALSMNFKTDSKVSFLTNDRRFVYDPTATRRNVFRTYIPTSMSRGRYLIRQVKHDVPLENLIITGQTIVMRDSGSTRVQKDRDDN
jgi:hypothetical protein